MKPLIAILSAFVLAACNPDSENSDGRRGFNTEQLALGKQTFATHCQECHGVAAAGVVREWHKPLADGSMPAPPLNGSAHAWHHSDEVLLRTVNMGGIPLGGTMPPFRDVLDEEQKTAVLAYIKSLWPDELYAAWKERNAS